METILRISCERVHTALSAALLGACVAKSGAGVCLAVGGRRQCDPRQISKKNHSKPPAINALISNDLVLKYGR
jgi:hypothetical protein